MQARFYAPMYHRFLSPDPGRDQHFEETQSWNIYSYVQNNPVMTTDPTGMFGWSDVKAFATRTAGQIYGAHKAVVGGIVSTGLSAATGGLSTAYDTHKMLKGGGIVPAVKQAVQDYKSGSEFQKGSTEGVVGMTLAMAAMPLVKGGGSTASSGAVADAAEASILRVATPGKPQFQLRPGESGLSVFDAAKVGTETVLQAFREGSQVVSKSISEITAKGLSVVSTPGDANLPVSLQKAHMEIRPGAEMTRNQFKTAIKELEGGK